MASSYFDSINENANYVGVCLKVSIPIVERAIEKTGILLKVSQRPDRKGNYHILKLEGFTWDKFNKFVTCWMELAIDEGKAYKRSRMIANED